MTDFPACLHGWSWTCSSRRLAHSFIWIQLMVTMVRRQGSLQSSFNIFNENPEDLLLIHLQLVFLDLPLSELQSRLSADSSLWSKKQCLNQQFCCSLQDGSKNWLDNLDHTCTCPTWRPGQGPGCNYCQSAQGCSSSSMGWTLFTNDIIPQSGKNAWCKNCTTLVGCSRDS